MCVLHLSWCSVDGVLRDMLRGRSSHHSPVSKEMLWKPANNRSKHSTLVDLVLCLAAMMVEAETHNHSYEELHHGGCRFRLKGFGCAGDRGVTLTAPVQYTSQCTCQPRARFSSSLFTSNNQKHGRNILLLLSITVELATSLNIVYRLSMVEASQAGLCGAGMQVRCT